MPAESTIAIVAAASMSAAFFFAGAVTTPAQEVAVHDAVEAAQIISHASEERTLMIAFGGGIMGAFVSWGFGFFKGDGRQQAKRMAASAVAAPMVAPYYMLWSNIPQTVIPTVFVASAVGLLAHVLVPIVTEIVPQWLRGKLPIKGNETKNLDP